MGVKKTAAVVPAVEPMEPLPAFGPYGEHGHLVANDHSKSREVKIDGARWEHVSEAPDGRWVYAKS